MRTQEPDLFGEPADPQTKRIFLRKIEARFRNEIIGENVPAWVSKRFTTPQQIFEMFIDLRLEAKEKHHVRLPCRASPFKDGRIAASSL